jgi:hypothetical protein
MNRDPSPSLHAVRLLRPHEVADDPSAPGVGAHDDRIAAEPLGLPDDSLGRLPCAEHLTICLDATFPQSLDRVRDGVAPILPLLLVRVQAGSRKRKADAVDARDREYVDGGADRLREIRSPGDRGLREWTTFGRKEYAPGSRRARVGKDDATSTKHEGNVEGAPPGTPLLRTYAPGVGTASGGGADSYFLSSTYLRYQCSGKYVSSVPMPMK